MYPVTLFVHSMRVSGLADGAYEYLPHAHALAPVRDADPVDPAVLFEAPGMEVDRAGFVITYVYNLYHNSRKYGDCGTVFGLIEVGGISQNVHLARNALALAGCDQGGFDKQVIEAALGLDGHTRHVVLVTVIGQEG
jgi:SagB-type dehydrogenase family enzyme